MPLRSALPRSLSTPLLGTTAAALALTLAPATAAASAQDTPPADSPVDVDKARVTKLQKVPAGVDEIATTELAPGRRKVVREGRPGVRKVVALRTFHDGEPVRDLVCFWAERCEVTVDGRPVTGSMPGL